MDCETCQKALVIKATYTLKGNAYCSKCKANINLDSCKSTYLGIIGDNHVFLLNNKGKCLSCNNDFIEVWLPHTDTSLANELFAKVKIPETSQV